MLVAWALRTQPALSWHAAPAVPAWATAAIATGVTPMLTPVGQLLGLLPLPLRWLPAVIALILAAPAAHPAARLPLLGRL